MEAIVLAGGFGTRLREVVADVPKPMAPIAGRPFLEILLSVLAKRGFTRVVLSLGYLAHQVVGHFGSTFAGMELVYEVEVSPLGTGGAIRGAARHCLQDHYFVFNGDSFLDIDIASLEAYWQAHHVPTIVARALPDTQRFGRLLVDGERIVGFLPKGEAGPGLINGGCYVFGRDELSACSIDSPFSIETDYFPAQVQARRFDCFVCHGHFIDIGVPADFARAQVELAQVGR